MRIMKFKELLVEDIEYIKHVYYSKMSHKEKTDVLTKKYGVQERAIRKWWEKLDLKKLASELSPQLQRAQKRTLNKDTEIVLVTSAQNKTAVNSDMIGSMKAYAEYLTNELGKKTEIVVIPTRYRNPTNNIEDDKTKASDWWVDEVENYLFYGKMDFGDVKISADSRISPTAKDPLIGYELLANSGHVVLPHSKIHFKTLPRLRGESLRVMCTTGYLTVKNYSKSKAGELGFEHHSNGFVVLEKKSDNTCYIPRNVKVNSDGEFVDIIYHVKGGKVKKIDSSLGFVFGDLHSELLNSSFYKETKNIVGNLLKPKKIILHDVFDGSTVNPHEEKDLFIKRKKILEGKHLIQGEIERTLEVVKDLNTLGSEVFVVESNHDIFLDRFINNFNWKNDLHNSDTYLKLAHIQQTVNLEDYGNIFGYLLHERFGKDVKYLKMGDSLKIAGYECGLHGDYGTNGSKGQTKTFSRMNTKMIHAHTHAPMMHNNVTCVGVTCWLEQYYNRKGYSSWAYAHSVIHNNGKNQLLVFGDDLKLSSLI